MNYQEIYKSKLVPNEKAVASVKSGDSVWIPPVNDAPVALVEALCQRYESLRDVMLHSSLSSSPLEVFKGKYKGHIGFTTLFLGAYERKYLGEGNIRYTSVHLSKYGRYMEEIVKPRVAMVSVSPPDENGNMHYGPSGTFANKTAVDMAEVVIVNVNRKSPVIYGVDNCLNVRDVTYVCENDFDIPELPDGPIGDVEKKIASYIIDGINDGDTLQIGIGAIANAVVYGLDNKKDLGVHTEMLTNSICYLAKKGVINGARKNFLPNKIVGAFALGSKELYDFLDRNEMIRMAPVTWVNAYENIAGNDNMVSINAALMIDITGQICSESVGFKQISGTGGQLDFVLGSLGSKGGRSYFVFPSTTETKSGVESRIRISLPEGGAVTTPRTCVQYVVTEYGMANLYLKSFSDRAKALIGIAHPDFREELEFQAKKLGIII